MAVKYHVIVSLSDKTSIEYDEFAVSKTASCKSILSRFGFRKVKSIKSVKM